jgi:hypothetical protein
MPITLQENILPGETVKAEWPVNTKEHEKFLFKNDLEKQHPAVFLHHFKNVNITPHGILFSGLHIYSQFLVWQKHLREFNRFYLLRNYLRRKKKRTDPESTYVVCFDYWSMGYFHWLCDFLPRLVLMQEYLKTAVLLLPENHDRPYVRASLDAFGIRKIMWFSDDEYVHCAKTLVPGHAALSGNIRPALMKSIRERLIAFYQPGQSQLSRLQKIYVSRAKAKARFIRNEAEVIHLLDTFGFKTVHFEDYTLAEQIGMAYHCRYLVGLHGANLANILFMQPHSRVMELRIKGDDKRNFYFSLAAAAQLDYFYLPCDTVPGSHDEMPDFDVDIALLKTEVERMLTG